MFFLKELPTRAMLQSYSDRYPGMDAGAVAEALRLLRRASLLMRALEAYFTAHTLSQTRFLILIVIDREPGQGGLMGSEIADRLDISRPVVTETVKAMMRAGLLGSAPVPGDGRAKRITLTPAGRAVLADLLPGYFALIADFMAREGDGTA
ncbi:MarR family winged helix-turn-helix transcriptional regulator [Methylobacterium sp. Leaf112]|uniref:MarR family winged helix-turn-helix transcriptional regulator n=1 Tax=Methylobacterium sp. Leaf112 TaxID=1736258 RepID=UPI0006F3120F|nr:MarR family transcriptional regulator [Methylobacterium sp. Leaf112]KQP59595.1 MarR family transcriptional regulator [Methylobacterium sp. Leaf112]